MSRASSSPDWEHRGYVDVYTANAVGVLERDGLAGSHATISRCLCKTVYKHCNVKNGLKAIACNIYAVFPTVFQPREICNISSGLVSL